MSTMKITDAMTGAARQAWDSVRDEPVGVAILSAIIAALKTQGREPVVTDAMIEAATAEFIAGTTNRLGRYRRPRFRSEDEKIRALLASAFRPWTYPDEYGPCLTCDAGPGIACASRRRTPPKRSGTVSPGTYTKHPHRGRQVCLPAH